MLLALAPSNETLPDLIILLEKRNEEQEIGVPGPVINAPEQSLFWRSRAASAIGKSYDGSMDPPKGRRNRPRYRPLSSTGTRTMRGDMVGFLQPKDFPGPWRREGAPVYTAKNLSPSIQIQLALSVLLGPGAVTEDPGGGTGATRKRGQGRQAMIGNQAGTVMEAKLPPGIKQEPWSYCRLASSEVRLSRLAAQNPPNIDLFFSYWSFLVIFWAAIIRSFARPLPRLPGEPNRCKAS